MSKQWANLFEKNNGFPFISSPPMSKYMPGVPAVSQSVKSWPAPTQRKSFSSGILDNPLWFQNHTLHAQLASSAYAPEALHSGGASSRTGGTDRARGSRRGSAGCRRSLTRCRSRPGPRLATPPPPAQATSSNWNVKILNSRQRSARESNAGPSKPGASLHHRV